MSTWEKAILFLTIAMTLAVIGKLWSTGLVKAYKVLFAFLLLDLFATAAALYFSSNPKAYGYVYLVAQTFKFLISIFALLEMYGLALERTPALAAYGRRTVGYLLAAAAIGPLSLLFIHHASSTEAFFRGFLQFDQTMNGTVAIFLILTSLFIAWFPVTMRRNVIVYVSGFIVWALSKAVVVFLINRRPGDAHLNAAANLAGSLLILGCLFWWFIAMKREGEGRTAVVGHLWNRAEAEKLTEQLAAINENLERMRRR